MSNITILWPCTRGFVITDRWADHLARPGYKAIYAGTDLAGPEQPLRGSHYDGRVLQAHMSSSGYGYTTFVEYAGVIRIRNAHQKDLGVKVGDTVTPETYLGTMDNTGNSTGTHTHFETWILAGGQWRNIDPLDSKNGIIMVSSPEQLRPLSPGQELPPVDDLPDFPIPVIVKPTSSVSSWINLRQFPIITSPKLGEVRPGQEWEAYAMQTDYLGNVWFAVRRGNMIGWAAAIYNGSRWLAEAS